MTPRPLDPPEPVGEPRTDALRTLLAVVDRLRDPDGGCPWDLEQTVTSMAPSLIEEAHEFVEAVEAGDEPGTIEEAGDVLMNVVLICRIAQDEGRFDLADAARAIADKLVRRHPHVFGDATAADAPEVLENWERIKRSERREKREDASALAGVPTGMPALQRAHRLSQKAVAAGFRWDDAQGALRKLREETDEVTVAFEEARSGGAQARARLADELGDVMVAAAFLAQYVDLEPEGLAREALRRFERRFRAMELEFGGALEGRPLAELLAAWERAKLACD